MAFCLLPRIADDLASRLKSGELKAEDLAKMTSEARNAKFREFMSKENAHEVNAAFESRMILKRQNALNQWVDKAKGVSPEIKRALQDKIQKMASNKKIFNPANETAFLKDLVHKKLNVGVSHAETKAIVDLAKQVTDIGTPEFLSKMKEGKLSLKERMAYGRKLVELQNYVKSLKLEAGKSSFSLKRPGEALVKLGGITKSLKATLDNSAIGRQGFKVLLTNPRTWLKNSVESFKDMTKTLSGKDVISEILADVQTRPNHQLYVKEKLALGSMEEAFPEHLSGAPIAGKLFKASEDAYTGFMYRTRADLFDTYVDLLKGTEGNIEGLGKFINSLTGRGNLGKFEPSADLLNNLFFSPRYMKSTFDILTGQVTDWNKMSPAVRKQAAIASAKVLGISALTLYMANQLVPGSAQLDPRGSDFGKIKIGDNYFDVTGGISGMATLASRIATGSYKSIGKPQVKKLNTGEFGSQTAWDMVEQFMSNKYSPVLGAAKNLANRQDFDRKPLTAGKFVSDLITPLPITKVYDLLTGDKDFAEASAIWLLEFVGIPSFQVKKK